LNFCCCKIKNKIIFPENLEKLHFENSVYNFKLDNLPHSIKLLYIETYKNILNDPLDNLPQSLQTLNIYCSEYKYPLNFLPNSIVKIKLLNYNFELDNLPSSLEKLELDGFKKKLNNLPLQLKKLYLINYEYDGNFNNLPESLEFMEIGFYAKIRGDIILPKNLKYFYHNGELIGKNIKLPDSVIETNYNCEIKQHFNFNFDSDDDDDANLYE
jgi:hypothetical protein